MTHKDDSLDFRTCKAEAFLIGLIQFTEIDGELLAGTFPDAYQHLGCEVDTDVSDACSCLYLPRCLPEVLSSVPA